MVYYPGVRWLKYLIEHTHNAIYIMGSSYVIPPSSNNECKLPLIHSLDLHGYQSTLPLLYRPAEVNGFTNPSPNQLSKPLTYYTPGQNQIPPVGYLSPGFIPQSLGYRTNYTATNVANPYTNNTSNQFSHITPASSPSRSDSSSTDGLSTLYNVATASEEISARERKSSESLEIQSDSKSTTPEVAILHHDSTKGCKPRKKRQCPECNLFFSNLATHKSTHLKPTSRPHVCKYCNRGFARPNDLFRHTRCHWKEVGFNKGQFKCPYKNHSTGDNCCHTSGIFSRCDTFKNHLKAIHFQYPNGTKKDQRNKVSGNCRMCHKFFTTVDDWLVNHVEKHECPFGN